MTTTENLGRYHITDELGRGAMGVVYKGIDPLLDRVVAIKTINLSLLSKDEQKEYEARFHQEAKATGRITHPNIVVIYDVGKSGDIAYMAMEFLDGHELRDILADGTRLPVEKILDVTAQVADGLSYAHEHEIVHRDIKPSNIMIVRDGLVKITDFGIARMPSSSVRTQTGMVLGSPKYMSPEQVMGKPTDQRSDIFSLGVVLYEMLTGDQPFVGDNINTIMFQTLNASPPPPSKKNPAVPEMLDFIVAKALAKKLDDRYQNAKDLARDLRECLLMLQRQQIAPTSPSVPMPTSTSATPMDDGSEEESKAKALALSKSFDSFEATMRMAQMTNMEGEMKDFAETQKSAAYKTQPQPVARPAVPRSTAPAPAQNAGMVWGVVVVLIVIAILVIALR
ncbi:MAG: serine/threonine-protein kinase [Pseudomonadota bacterium]